MTVFKRGVNLSYNFPQFSFGSSINHQFPRSPIYCGESLASEKETQAITRYYESIIRGRTSTTSTSSSSSSSSSGVFIQLDGTGEDIN